MGPLLILTLTRVLLFLDIPSPCYFLQDPYGAALPYGCFLSMYYLLNYLGFDPPPFSGLSFWIALPAPAFLGFTPFLCYCILFLFFPLTWVLDCFEML